MKKFEYLRATDLDTESLNGLGSDGWELISVISPYSFKNVGINSNYSENLNCIYVFKREISK